MTGGLGVSHSELLAKQVLDQYFGNFKELDNARVSWLEGLEIDRLYPSLGIAIEFQGDQHYRVVPGMHRGPVDFQKQLHLDTKKRNLLEKQGIKLYSINLLDLDRFRVKNLLRKMAEDGKIYALNKGYKEEIAKLQRIRWDQEPDEILMRRTDRISKMKKSYYQPVKKTWWKKILGV